MASSRFATGNQTRGSGSRKDESVNNMLLRLGIDDDEIDDLAFEEQEDAPKEGIKWMALARVHTIKNFSPQTFEQHMRVAWSPAREVKFNHHEGNLFTIQCFCLGDWLKVEQGGPGCLGNMWCVLNCMMVSPHQRLLILTFFNVDSDP
uniref:Uncharacterized protein n=1 Tax=Avena sativa TaxID=4498 RepID=A0ACD6A4J7_AVESA